MTGASRIRRAVPTADDACFVLPDAYPATEAGACGGQVPGSVPCPPRGSRFERRFVNRRDSARNGGSGRTRDPVPPGGSFEGAFDLPDADPHRDHARTNSMDQLAHAVSRG